MPLDQVADRLDTSSTDLESDRQRTSHKTTVTDEDDLDSSQDGDKYQAGIKLRDLTDSEVHQFPGLKREHWW